MTVLRNEPMMYFVFNNDNEIQSQAGGSLGSFRSLVRQLPDTCSKALDNLYLTLYPCQADVGDLSSAELSWETLSCSARSPTLLSPRAGDPLYDLDASL
jgi:hypothetical protein